MNKKPWLDQLEIITAVLSTSLSESFQRYKEGEVLCVKNKYEASAAYQ